MSDQKYFSTDQKLAGLYRSGLTLQEIGDKFGITRERVRQIISRLGVKAEDGGFAYKERIKAKKRKRLKDRASILRNGCDHSKYLQILRGPKSRNGVRPTWAFKSQRSAANFRNIPWRLKLADWWDIWEASGKWSQRGRGMGYAMCRFEDRGAYEIGNVYIAGMGDNGREYMMLRHNKTYEMISDIYVPAEQ